jgi:hypothetical protein
MDYNSAFSNIKDTKIQTGDIIFLHKANKATELSQYILTHGSQYSSATHTGIVVGINEDSIQVLEACLDGGVQVSHYDQQQFKEYVGKELHVLRNIKLQDSLDKVSSEFAGKYEANKVTEYAYHHLLTCAVRTIKDDKIGRTRTIRSYNNMALMDSKGNPRKAAMCSELVAEIVKISQIYSMFAHTRTGISQKELKNLQKIGAILNFSAEATNPAELEKVLVEKHGFQKRVIN